LARKADIRLRRSNTANAIPTHSNLSDGEMAMTISGTRCKWCYKISGEWYR